MTAAYVEYCVDATTEKRSGERRDKERPVRFEDNYAFARGQVTRCSTVVLDFTLPNKRHHSIVLET
ncbi:hypothetical protein [Halococcus hamelinensis]|uniref:Uncharacterized protein n=1 Tax=Halococcus hamelinensis 100A6 TaxID=1132509 RepID=M0M027_9EURY|nr:hypothetical protein [Halococcus hamelinensis]EMA37735.1 hypothetical protein C447_12205 [Halococcus hamelinensis 100A6]